jgi:hypothetical protein
MGTNKPGPPLGRPPLGRPDLDTGLVAEVSAWHSNLSTETHRMLDKWPELQV